MDKIIIRDLRLHGIIGIEPEERERPQTILVNAIIYTDTRRAAATEDINHTVNYHAISQRISQHVADASPWLVEKLADDIARIVLTEFAVERVRIRVEKPDILPQATAVGVEIDRRAKDYR
jgi:7,8-dihydroneopterin aldolase/epimerase/oxygenase